MNSNKSFSRFVLVTTLTILPVTSGFAAEPDALIKATSQPTPSAARPAEAASQAEEAEAMTTESASAKAQYYQRQAETYRSFGGVGYKAGLVQRAEANAARFAALATELRSSAVEQPARSPEAEHYAQLAEQYRRIGGVAYKTGLVQAAEAQQRKYEPVPVSGGVTVATNQSYCSSKPTVCFLAREKAAPAARRAAVALRTDEAMTAESASAMAQYYQRQAETYRSFGGVGYKGGLVQQAEANAARFAALATELRLPVAARPMRSVEAEHFAQLAERYRRMGGAAYKTGLVERAEALQRKYESVLVIEVPMLLAVNPSYCASKPAVCSGARVN